MSKLHRSANVSKIRHPNRDHSFILIAFMVFENEACMQPVHVGFEGERAPKTDFFYVKIMQDFWVFYQGHSTSLSCILVDIKWRPKRVSELHIVQQLKCF